MDKKKDLKEKPTAEEHLPVEEPVTGGANGPAAEQGPSPLEELQGEFSALNERYLRVLAEYDNYRKRSAKERENLYPQAQADALTPLLSVLDNFDRALQTECSDESFRKGMEMIYNSLWEALTKLGVEAIGTAGEPFDPLLHNAVLHVEDDTIGENTVQEVFQKGYQMKGKVLRYAMVKVAN